MNPSSDITVIKIGGHAMVDPDLLAAFSEDVAKLTGQGHRIVIVHGGGPHINSLLKQLNLDSKFVNGLRVTDEHVLMAVEMSLAGSVNKFLTRQLLLAGISAAGISGEDGRLLAARQKDASLGFVGEVTGVDASIIRTLLEGGFTPVIAPLALSASGQLLNVNADSAAGAIAAALSATKFLLVSDVPGVLDEHKNLLPELDNEKIRTLVASRIISGGMLPKLECCQSALAHGCRTAIILDGKRKNSISLCLEAGDIAGTVIHNRD